MASEKIKTIKPLLVMVYGYPGSGKTRFVSQLISSLQAAHIDADRIRNELFDNPRYDRQENDVLSQLMDYMTGEFLSAGLSVVYDTNAMRQKQRLELRELARKHGARALLVWLQIDTESAYARVVGRDRRRSEDKYAMPLDRATFDKICAYMQNPQPTEDYIVVSGKHVFKTQLASVVKKLHDLKLVNLSDVQNKLPRPALVNLVPQNTRLDRGRFDVSRRNVTIR